MRVPQSDYTFHFTVALRATYTQGPGNPPCLRDSRFQAGVVIPQQSATRFMIPLPTGSSIPLNIGGSVSLVNLFCNGAPTVAGNIFGQFVFGDGSNQVTYQIGIQMPPDALYLNAAAVARAFGMYVSQSSLSLGQVINGVFALSGRNAFTPPAVFNQFVVNSVEICFAPGANIEFYAPDYQPGANCPQGLTADVQFSIPALANLGVRGTVAVVMGRRGRTPTFGSLDSTLEVSNPTAAVSSLVSAVRSRLRTLLPNANVGQFILDVINNAIEAQLSRVSIEHFSVVLSADLSIVGPVPSFQVRIVGNFAGRRATIQTPTLHSAITGMSSVLNTISARSLGSLVGLQIPSRICTPQSCRRVCVPRTCLPWPANNVCAGGGCSNVCVPPVQVCVSNPFASMSVSYQRLSLYGHRVERNIVAAGEAFYANVTHDHVAEEEPYYTQFDAVKPPSATQKASDAADWAAHVKNAFEDDEMLALNLPAFGKMMAATNNTDSGAPAMLNADEYVSSLYEALALGLGEADFDEYALPDGGLYDSAYDAQRKAADQTFTDLFHEIHKITNKLGVSGAAGIPLSAWHAGKHEVYAHVKEYAVRKTEQHRDALLARASAAA